MEHFYQNIQGMFRWPEIYKRAVELAPENAEFVEIGCFQGRSTACLATEVFNSGKSIKIHAIDLWDPSRKIGCSVEEFFANMGPVKAFVNPLKGSSHELHRLFQDNSLDFVFVDGDHSFPAVIADIRNWWRKLKPGGWMAGDDLIHGGVRHAVEEFFGPECSTKHPEGRWIRFQSSSVYHYDKSTGISPTMGGQVWWTESKQWR